MTVCKQKRGFTLIEMLVVLIISLLLMLLIVPVFRVSTGTVQAVERKLAVYEAARNLLDMVEIEVQHAALNERGEHFAIKNVSFQDNDPFTPAGTGRYYFSRREANAIHYLKYQAGGYIYDPDAQYPAGMEFPLCYPNHPSWQECFMSVLRSDLLYSKGSAYWEDDASIDQTHELMDVSAIGTFGTDCERKAENNNYQPPQGPVPSDEPSDFFAPNHELTAPQYCTRFDNTAMGRRLGQYRIMDLGFSYWDDVVKQFKDVPDNMAVYFAPPPKALRITITVCDRDKRLRGTFSRVVVIPVGSGDGVVTDSQDTDFSLSANLYNHTKNLKVIDPLIYGKAGPP
jgi:prepilin-type N-terminal cleavage/methylation domain-containing protein